MRDVWMKYGEDSTDFVLKGVSLDIQPGEKVRGEKPGENGKRREDAITD